VSAPTPDSWHAANHGALTAAVATVRAWLEARPATDVPRAPAPEAPPELGRLAKAFGLTCFEQHVLLLCAGMELDVMFAACCAAAQGEPRRTYPTFGLALAALPEAHWSALLPSAPLRRWRLVEVEAADSLVAARLRLDERILHHLTGLPCLDERLRGLVTPVKAPDDLPPSQRAQAERIAALWSPARPLASWPVVQLCGPDAADREAVAAAACASVGLGLHTLRAADVPTAPVDRQTLATLWDREAVLSGSALLIDSHAAEPDTLRAVTAFVESLEGPAFLAAREPLRPFRRPAVRLDVARPTAAEQLSLWQSALGPHSEPLNGQLGELVTHFRLSWPGIRAASSAAHPDSPDAARALWDACRAQARPKLDDLAQRIESAAGWDDLVLPAGQRQTLEEIAVHVRQRGRVYDAWGFGARGGRGLGISALFAGPSGTGKTLAAEVLAGALRLDLYRIDLSQVVSKYIGETERNLARVFDAAEEGGAVLLFDEADALFGKRGEVKDSHDRYANIEVSYLLQRMETYRGLAILTTNLKESLDPAFLRRLRFVVLFPFPDAAQRAAIWRRAFPPQTPTAGLSAERLARLAITGGNIRNIALNAAFLAADAGEPVGMAHVLRAARSEYAKLDKVLTEAEAGGWE
jgi:ATPase family associated with various cellular activities (AAA)